MLDCDNMFFPDFMELSNYVDSKMRSRKKKLSKNEVTYG